MNISLCEQKSGQMLQAVKQSLTWMTETFEARFPVSVNSLQWAVRPHLYSALSKFKCLAATVMFEPTLSLFSRHVSTVGSRRRYLSSRMCVNVAGRDSCRFNTIGCWLFIFWCSEDPNEQFWLSRDRFLWRTPRSQDRFALRQLLWPDYST